MHATHDAVLQCMHMQACNHAAAHSVRPAHFAGTVCLLLLLLLLLVVVMAVQGTGYLQSDPPAIRWLATKTSSKG